MAENREEEAISALVREGLARWGGGKPRGLDPPGRIKGGPIAETVLAMTP